MPKGILLVCRFVCRDRIGERQKCSAAFLPAIPEDAVVYGAGETSVILSKVRCELATRLGERGP